MKPVPCKKLRSVPRAHILCNPGMAMNSKGVWEDLVEEVHEAHDVWDRDSQQDWQLWAESVIHMPAALLGEAPEIAVVRTTFLKWVLMFFTAGKYAIMGIFPSRFLDRHAPKFLPTLLTLFALTEACLFSFLCLSRLCPLIVCRRSGLWPHCLC